MFLFVLVRFSHLISVFLRSDGRLLISPRINNANEILLYAPKQSMCYYSKLNPCSHLINFEFYPKQLSLKKVNGYKKYSFIK